jgi:hypothetical protein
MASRSPLLDSRSTVTAAASTHSVFTSGYGSKKIFMDSHRVVDQ